MKHLYTYPNSQGKLRNKRICKVLEIRLFGLLTVQVPLICEWLFTLLYYPNEETGIRFISVVKNVLGFKAVSLSVLHRPYISLGFMAQ